MNTITSLKSHIKRVSKYNDVALYKEIDSFIELNNDLSEEELLKKLYGVYENRIKLLEASTHAKAIICIKEWVVTFGVLSLLGFTGMVIYYLLALIEVSTK